MYPATVITPPPNVGDGGAGAPRNQQIVSRAFRRRLDKEPDEWGRRERALIRRPPRFMVLF